MTETRVHLTATTEGLEAPVITDYAEAPVLRTPFAYWDVVETTTYGDYFEDELIAGKTYGKTHNLSAARVLASDNPWEPFHSARDFEIAKWFLDFNIAKGAINAFFAKGLDGDQTKSFWSGDQLWNLLETSEFGFGATSWTRHEIDNQHFYTRDLRTCIQLLLGHHPFAGNMHFAPIQTFDKNNHRVYEGMHTASWWSDTQGHLPEGGTLIPLIFASDKTHLTNFSGDKSIWPVHLTIGNIDKSLRAETSKRAWVLVGLLPCTNRKSNNSRPKKQTRIPENLPAAPELDSQDLYHAAIEILFRTLIYPNYPSQDVNLSQTSSRPIFLTTTWEGFSWECADGFIRRCFPVVAAWVADCPEHQLITRTRQFACPRCEIPIAKTGHEKPVDRQHTLRDQDDIRKLVNTNSAHSVQILDEKNLFPVPNIFWKLPMCNAYRLWQPDILHQVWIGVSATMMGWLTKWLKKHKLLARFNDRWKLQAKLPNLQNFTKTYEGVKQWTGKERRHMMLILVPVFIPLLVGPTGRAHKPG